MTTPDSPRPHLVPTSSPVGGRPRGDDLVPRPHPIGDEVTSGSPTTTSTNTPRPRPRDEVNETSLPNPADLVNQLFPRRRSRLQVELDLDPVPGWGNHPDHHRALVQRLLDDAIPHYNPTVALIATDGAPDGGSR